MHYEPRGSEWRLVRGTQRRALHLPLIGDFNVANALGAAAAAWALGRVAVATIAARLATQPQVPGRLEIVHEHPTVLRDYAHTPDALERALAAVRPFTRERLIVVFGAGGDRDRGKRPLMGAVADRLGRSRDRHERQPAHGRSGADSRRHRARHAPDDHERIEDRRAAIARALERSPTRATTWSCSPERDTRRIRCAARQRPVRRKAIVASPGRCGDGGRGMLDMPEGAHVVIARATDWFWTLDRAAQRLRSCAVAHAAARHAPLAGVSHRHARDRARRSVRRARGRALRRARLSRRGRGARRRGGRRVAARARRPGSACRCTSCADTLVRARRARPLPAPRVGAARTGGRGRRVERQDEHQGAASARRSARGSRCTPRPATSTTRSACRSRCSRCPTRPTWRWSSWARTCPAR